MTQKRKSLRRHIASSLKSSLTRYLQKVWRVLPYWLLPVSNRATMRHDDSKVAHPKEGHMANRSRLLATVVVSLAIVVALPGCGGGSSADVATQQTPAVVVPVAPAASPPTTPTATILAVKTATGESTAQVTVSNGTMTGPGTAVIGGVAATVTTTGAVVDATTGKALILPVTTVSAVATLPTSAGSVTAQDSLTGTCLNGLSGVNCTVPTTAWSSSTAVFADLSQEAATASWRQLGMSDDGKTIVRLVLPQGTHNCGADGKRGPHKGLVVSCDGLTANTAGTYEVWPASDRKSMIYIKIDNVDHRKTPSYDAVTLINKLAWPLCENDTGRAIPGSSPAVCMQDVKITWFGGGTIASIGLQMAIMPSTLTD